MCGYTYIRRRRLFAGTCAYSREYVRFSGLTWGDRPSYSSWTSRNICARRLSAGKTLPFLESAFCITALDSAKRYVNLKPPEWSTQSGWSGCVSRRIPQLTATLTRLVIVYFFFFFSWTLQLITCPQFLPLFLVLFSSYRLIILRALPSAIVVSDGMSTSAEAAKMPNKQYL
ncbi:uncharacterized protein BDW43DRAFT_278432 [Aspergillus alliaceus]|uniref:uncharacterized protein n=1 Tax=Petromyces alliaceus TaxID=209559 RepID=UPI0012A4DDB8|nr:uncharacterized protein BDW43DRAFT_278432 [Aspergillus alliaceus]KAB8232734.1 hypothetical protein BDW43DRAFT_278432 [Aspergillus alliaceus]